MNTHMRAVPRFRRALQTRHLIMLSLGGVIGTGLFLSIGYTIHETGPLGAIIAYLVGGSVVFLVMMSLGELAVHMPVTGAFSCYAARYINPSTGYMIGWLYWLNWSVTIGSEFTASGILMSHWFSHVPIWIWSVLFGAVIFLANAFTVKLFAEMEFWLTAVKVGVILLFILMGVAVIAGLWHVDGQATSGLANFTREGWFPTGVMPIVATMISVSFAFSGTELIGIAAGESSAPEKDIPKAIRANIWRLFVFFVGTIAVIATLVPREEAGLLESPFVTVFSRMGLPYAGDIMNLVILVALLSTANSGLYGAARMLWTLGDQGTLPSCFSRLTRKGVPLNAIIFSMLGGAASLLSSIYAANTVYLALVSVSGLSVVVVWMSISASHIGLRRHMAREGISTEMLAYRAPWYPWLPVLALILCALACFGMLLDPTQRVAVYISVGFIVFFYALFYVQQRKCALLGRDAHKQVVTVSREAVR